MNRIIVLAVCCLALQAAPALAQVQVIANPSVGGSSISISALQAAFLGAKSKLPDGSLVQPVLAEDGEPHLAFLKYLGKSDRALRTHLKSLVFSGNGSMPKSFASDAEIVKYVASTKGAIGYVGPTSDTAGVKKLEVK